jgi:hypothetical protein
LLRIRKEQMDVFQSASEAELCAAVADWLRGRAPEELASTSDEALLGRVGWGIRRARHWQIEDERSIAIFVSLLFRIGPHFDRHPEVVRYLEEPTRTPEERLAHLVQNFEAWSAVRDQAPPNAWEIH